MKDPLEQLATFSPLRFDAELGSKSVYKGAPRRELDEAWKKLVDRRWDYFFFVCSRLSRVDML